MIVLAAFLRIGQNFVGLVDLFESLFSRLVPWFPVRMILSGQAAKGFFDLLLTCLSWYAKDLVIVLIVHPDWHPSSASWLYYTTNGLNCLAS
jgi:hypothetical protein